MAAQPVKKIPQMLATISGYTAIMYI